MKPAPLPLPASTRLWVLAAAFGGLLFDGVELGLMPIASLSVSQDLLGDRFTPTVGGDWFARFTAALMLGAAIGGIALGRMGDALGRTRALGISILFYSVFAGLGAFVRTQEQMLALRFLVGLGVGGVWPNAVALAAECWPDRSRPVIAGILGAALNAGILLLSQLARHWEITPDSWRWLFQLAALPAILGVLTLTVVPESPRWRSTRGPGRGPAPSDPGSRGATPSLLRPPLRSATVTGILLGTIPLVGAWSAGKWMIPWADKVGGATQAGYKAVTQGWWALGAVIGSFLGAQVASRLGRRRAYALISAGATALTLTLFLATAPLQPGFLPTVFAQGLVATLFFGWLPLYLPELFPTSVRAAGTGLAYNAGRFATAIGVFAAGGLFTLFDGSYSRVGATCGLVYSLGLWIVHRIPERPDEDLPD